VASLAGTFDEPQQRYAQQARQAIPEALHEFADSPDAARVLMLTLLRGSDPAVAARQDEVIRRTFGEALLERVGATADVALALAPALRLPAVQQLFPALRRTTVEERRELRGAVQQLVLADDRIDVFECCLLLLLEASLRESVEGGEEHGGQSLLQAVRPATVLFAILARRGAGDRGSAQAAYDAGMAHVFPHHRQPYATVERWPEALRQSLRELVVLRPSAKKVLIEGLVRTVAHDRQLSVAEGELLRTVCAVLHCPLPPILSVQA
jgi:hypothetical protein